MLKLSFTYLLQKNRQNKVREEQKTEIQSSQRAKKKKKQKQKPAELVVNLSLDGHEQRLIVARLRAIVFVLDVLTKI